MKLIWGILLFILGLGIGVGVTGLLMLDISYQAIEDHYVTCEYWMDLSYKYFYLTSEIAGEDRFPTEGFINCNAILDRTLEYTFSKEEFLEKYATRHF
jgi:hypothetical protein